MTQTNDLPEERMSNPAEPETDTASAVEEAAQVVIRKTPRALAQRDPVNIAEHFWKSGFFPDVKSMSQAVVKVIAGEELGLGRMASVEGITMIEGKLGFKANLVATLIKRHPTYDYKVTETTNDRCVIEFYDGEDLVGVSEFTLEDAQRAELVKPRSNWAKYPKAMCFNRALTQGTRTYIPDVTSGTTVYTDDEIEEVITEAPAEAAESPVATLTPERVDHLAKGVNAAGAQLADRGVNALDGLNMILGSLGVDGFTPNETLEAQLARLTDQQADALDAELQKLVDAGAAGEDSDAG